MSSWRGLSVLILGLTLAVRTATAQPAPAAAPASEAPAETAPPTAKSADASAEEDRKRQEAKERFVRGLALANESNWDAALVEFQASIELFPTRVAMANAAISLRNLKRYAEAVAMYRDYLKHFGEQVAAEEKRQIEETLGELRPYIGEIDVESREKGAIVVVDGQERGRTPLAEPISVNAGTHSVRVSKQGFQPFEAQLAVAGKQRKTVNAELKPLMRSGTLVVNEADGKVLDVLVDGAIVGKTPWQGLIGVGVHSVALRGEDDLGTAPSSAQVRDNQSTALSLRAQQLDAELRVEPVPTNARVHVDGVAVGTGVWQGRLSSGPHRVEVVAEGHVPFQREIKIKIGQREILRVSLERDLGDAMWTQRFRPHVYVELMGGLALTPSLGGSADRACNTKVTLPDGSSAEGCSDQPLGLGGLGAARGGYQLTSGLGIEVFAGYLYLQAERKRTVVADAEGSRVAAKDYEDSTTVAAPLAALGASYHFLDFLIGRISIGAARARVSTSNKGTFVGDAGAMSVPVSQLVAIPETPQNVWMPFIAPEVQGRLRFGERFSVALGVSAFIMFPSASSRGSNASFSNAETRATPLRSGSQVLAVVQLPREEALGTFFAVVPTLGARLEF